MLFDPDVTIPPSDAARWAQSAAQWQLLPHYDARTTPGLRPIGAGIARSNPMLAWDEDANKPVASPDGGHYIVVAAPANRSTAPTPRGLEHGTGVNPPPFGLARDTATGEVILWDVDAADYWPTLEGDAVAIDPALLKIPELNPARIASLIGAAVEVDAIANAPLHGSPGAVHAAQSLHTAAQDPEHPLHAFRDLINDLIPRIASDMMPARFWGNARAIEEVTDQGRTLVNRFVEALENPALASQLWGPSAASGPNADSDSEDGTESLASRIDGMQLADTGGDIDALFDGDGGGETAGNPIANTVDLDALAVAPSDHLGTRIADDAGTFVLWNEDADTPITDENGAHYAGDLIDPSGRFAVVTNSANGETVVWDIANGAALAGIDGGVLTLAPGSAIVRPDEAAFVHGLALDILALTFAENQEQWTEARTRLAARVEELDDDDNPLRPMHVFVQGVIDTHSGLLNKANAANRPEDAVEHRQQARDRGLGAAQVVLSPMFAHAMFARQLEHGQMSADELRDRFADATGFTIAEPTAEGEYPAFVDGNGTAIISAPTETLEDIMLDVHGGERLDTFAAWKTGEIDAWQAAAELTESFARAGNYDALEDVYAAAEEIQAAIDAGELDWDQASRLMLPALYPDMEFPTEFVTELVLDMLPIIGNARAAEALAEDIEAISDAVERGDWAAAAGNGLLAVLDAAGTVTGLVVIPRAVKHLVFRVGSRSERFRQFRAKTYINWMNNHGTEPFGEVPPERYFRQAWHTFTPEMQNRIGGLYNYIKGAAGENHLFKLFEDMGIDVITVEDLARLDGKLPPNTIVRQQRVFDETTGITRIPDGLSSDAGGAYELLMLSDELAERQVFNAIETKVDGSRTARQERIDELLEDADIIAGAHYFRIRVRDIPTNEILDLFDDFLSRPKWASLTDVQKDAIRRDVIAHYHFNIDRWTVIDLYIMINMSASARLLHELADDE